MKSDPMDEVNRVTVERPPSRGPGSGKEAWVRFALDMAESNGTLWEMVDRQSELIRELQAEIGLLRNQIAKRKPKGGRPPTPDHKIASIERDLAAGLSRRQIAARNGVSAMTVTRVAQRVALRVAECRRDTPARVAST